jgi:hypothetical protein
MKAVAKAICLACALSVFTTSAALAAGPLKITKFSLQTTRTVEIPGTRAALEAARAAKETVTFTPENFGFENRPVSFTQAGGHPEDLTTVLEFENEDIEGNGPTPTRDPKDVAVTLPPGLLGNPTVAERCKLSVVLAGEQCSPGSQIGVAVIYIQHGEGRVAPVVNVVPEAGQSAEFAIETTDKISFILTAHVTDRENSVTKRPEYAVTVVSNGLPSVEITKTEITFWGVPSAKSHEAERGLACFRLSESFQNWTCGGINEGKLFGVGLQEDGRPEAPFLTMPSDCAAGPETATVRADSLEEPGRYVEAQAEMPLPTVLSGPQTGVTGCDLLQFTPTIAVDPDKVFADEPVDLGVTLTVPQFEEPSRPSTPPLRDAEVTLPAGMSVNPATVNGIQACNEAGPEGINFTGPESLETGLNGEQQLAPGHCPDASIVGRARAITPLLSEPVEGHVYLARPGCGGPGQAACTERDAADGNLYKLYLELGGKGTLGNAGVNIKVEGQTRANLATGQLTTSFQDNPQFPFSKLEVDLEGGQQAPLANSATCGPATTSADLTPWSASGLTAEGLLRAGTPDAVPSSFFDVEGCSNPTPFSPGFLAGTVNPNAGKLSAFTLDISRKDREQYVKGIRVHTPPGLLGVLASVPLCDEAQGNAGTCPEASKIGTTRVASGAGEDPFELEGSMYLTTSYRGAPFGLSIVTNAVAGPFNLGKVVVRARIDVDPTDSTLTVTTDESGPYAIPQIIFGVPLRLQRITANVNRPGFMFNPTSCRAQQVTATVSGSEGGLANGASPFAASECASLAFKPTFVVSTSGRTSRKNGASLDARLSYPKGALGRDANIARVKVSLPRLLPSRLTTLRRACPAQTFDANPAACPKGSIVGIARASTPLLPAIGSCAPGLKCSPKEPPASVIGPAYFVSFGGEAFPQLITVLEGDGVRVDLVGDTFISKGVTSSTFKTVPDVPVNSFELYLPQGSGSALVANGNLCRQAGKLVMPTEFVAQNGAAIHRRTHIKVTGCSKPRKVKAKRKVGKPGRKANGRRVGK